ncbi:MAG: energy-coupling factor transporter ATPase [Oscillospiraceae bacterium]
MQNSVDTKTVETDENIIEFHNVTFRYSSESENVLDSINLNIKRGDFIAVLGANGSGKSTLAKHMNAILLPTNGSVIANGYDTADEENILKIRKRVGMVFQNPDNQIVATVVEEDVAFALENLGLAPEKIRARVDEALEIVGMTKHATDAPHKLSGGQKQRVAIAGVLAMRPKCIILDEPTAMLDPFGRNRVIDTVLKLNREQGITVVLITHFMEEAALANRIVIMDKGRIAMDDTPQRVFSDIKRVRALELDVPPTTEFCVALNESGVKISRDIVSPAECIERLEMLLEGVKK